MTHHCMDDRPSTRRKGSKGWMLQLGFNELEITHTDDGYHHHHWVVSWFSAHESPLIFIQSHSWVGGLEMAHEKNGVPMSGGRCEPHLW